MLAYLTLFGIAFLAATLFPAQSELVLVAMHLSGDYNTALLLLAATAGNVLGSCVNYALGYYITHFKDRRWFPIKPAALERATNACQRWGYWTLLFAWLPIIGDALTLAAGIFRIKLWIFIPLVTLGKAARYIAILAALP